MAKQTVPDLKELFRQAAEIAQQVPEAMQAAAFNRAVDLLTGASSNAPTASGTPPLRAVLKKPQRKEATDQKDSADSIDVLMEQIDSTLHPGIRSSSTVLDRSLMVLQIARTEHNIDGLVPSDIARVLTEKFRINTSDVAVRMALGKVTNLVNRVKKGNAFTYRIMGPGEEYLADLKEGNREKPSSAPAPPRTKARRRKQGAAPQGTSTSSSSASNQPEPRGKGSARKRASGLGPKAAIVSLADGGFFATPRTGPQVQEHLRKKRGYDLGTDQLRLAMLRLVRDGILEREEGTEGQYEYKRP